MRKKISILFAIFGTLSLMAQTPEAMTMLDADQVPMEIKEEMYQAYPTAEVEQWYILDDIYAAKTSQDGISRYSKFNDQGLMIEEMLLKDWKDAPENLKQGKQKTTYKYWEVTEFYEVHKDNQLSQYFLMLKNDKNELKSMYFDTDGKLEGKSNTGY